jgi:regulator of nonsense transcripts 2
MRRKQNAQHLDQRLQLLLENAYYQVRSTPDCSCAQRTTDADKVPGLALKCNPPERLAVQQKERSPMELFIRHLIHDILIKKTVDKVLKLVRKLHWEDPEVRGQPLCDWLPTLLTFPHRENKVYELLHKAFTRVWKLKFSNIGALALVLYDLARFHSDFATGVVDQVLENIRSGLEVRSDPGDSLRPARKGAHPPSIPLSDQHLQAQPAPDRDHQVPRRATLLPPGQHHRCL